MVSIIAGVVLVALAIVGILVSLALGKDSSPALLQIIGLIVISVPGLIGAGYAERNQRDIRNGVVADKAREGAVAALQETGVTDVVNTSRESTVLAMRALTQLLETNTAATVTNTEAHKHESPEGG